MDVFGWGGLDFTALPLTAAILQTSSPFHSHLIQESYFSLLYNISCTLRIFWFASVSKIALFAFLLCHLLSSYSRQIFFSFMLYSCTPLIFWFATVSANTIGGEGLGLSTLLCTQEPLQSTSIHQRRTQGYVWGGGEVVFCNYEYTFAKIGQIWKSRGPLSTPWWWWARGAVPPPPPAFAPALN